MHAPEDTVESFLTTMPAVLYEYALHEDQSSEFLYVSPTSKEILGQAPEYFVQDMNRFWEMVHPDDLARLQEEDVSANSQNEFFVSEVRFRRPSGKEIWILISSKPTAKKVKGAVVWSGYIIDVTERKVNDEALRKSEEAYRAILETSKDWIWAIDLSGRHTYSNPAIKDILGYSADEIVGSHAIELVHDDDKAWLTVNIENWIRNKQGWNNLVLRWRHKEGGYRYLESNAVPSFNAEHELVGFRGVDRDITERRKIEDSLRESEEKYHLAMDAAQDGLWDWNVNTGEVYYSPGWNRILSEERVPHDYESWEKRIHPDDKARIIESLTAHLEGEIGAWQEEHRLRGANGSWVWVLGRGRVVSRDESGRPLRMVGTMTDISERKRAEEKLEYLATHDTLTGLYNRNELEFRLREELMRAERYKHALSLFMLDIDHFKSVNDNYGHQVGDSVLQRFARLLEESIRQTDYAARYGGEEFIIILPETGLSEAKDLADRLLVNISGMVIKVGDDSEINITASIGVSTFSEHGTSLDKLVSIADSAVYAAKDAGRNCVVVGDMKR